MKRCRVWSISPSPPSATTTSASSGSAGGMRSVYAWKGEVERGQECVGIVKTRASLAERAGAALKERHPYETPIVLFLETRGGDPACVEWLMGETDHKS